MQLIYFALCLFMLVKNIFGSDLNISFPSFPMEDNYVLKNHHLISNTIVNFLTKRFNSTGKGYRIVYAGSHPLRNFEFSDIASNIIQRTQGMPIFTDNLLLYPRSKFVLFINILDPKLGLTNLKLPTKTSVGMNVVYIVMPQLGQSEEEFLLQSEHVMRHIFQQYFYIYVLHVYVMIPNFRKELLLYTYNPYTSPMHCGDMTPILLKTFRNGNDSWPNGMFLKYVKMNINRCPITIVTSSNLPPYVILHPYKRKGLNAVKGIDGEILKILAQEYNFTILVKVGGHIANSHVYNNGTATGIYKWLLDKQANLTLGDTSCTPRRMNNLESTQAYYQTDMFIMLKPPKFTPIEILFLPLDISLIIVGIIIYILNLLLWKRLSRFHLKNSILGNALNRKIMLVGIFIVGCYRLAYESTYFSYIKNPPVKSFTKSLHQMHKAGYIIYYNNVAQSYIESYANDELKVLLKDMHDSEIRSYELFEEQIGYKIGVISKDAYYSRYLKLYRKDRNIKPIIKITIYLEQSCMYFPKHSYFKEPFGTVLGRLKSSGIISQIFVNQASLVSMEEHRKKHDYGLKWIPLTLKNIQGAFYLWIFLMSLYCLLFLIELILPKFKVLNNFYANL